MPTIPPATLTERLNWRYATKKFDPAKPIDPAAWEAILHALVMSPSSYGLQPWKFLVIDDPALRARLRPLSWNQPQITDAARLLVIARRVDLDVGDVDRHVARISQVRSVPVAALSGFRDVMAGSVANPPTLPGGSTDTYVRSQCYIALGFALAAAALQGVDACPMEGFDPVKYDEALGLDKQGLKSTVVASFGHRAADDTFAPDKAPKVRFDRSELIEVR